MQITICCTIWGLLREKPSLGSFSFWKTFPFCGFWNPSAQIQKANYALNTHLRWWNPRHFRWGLSLGISFLKVWPVDGHSRLHLRASWLECRKPDPSPITPSPLPALPPWCAAFCAFKLGKQKVLPWGTSLSVPSVSVRGAHRLPANAKTHTQRLDEAVCAEAGLWPLHFLCWLSQKIHQCRFLSLNKINLGIFPRMPRRWSFYWRARVH